tara:strand:+ start:1636 stop:2700 length:1065 start_codon:yes stop_codon:yes gene_type:complete
MSYTTFGTGDVIEGSIVRGVTSTAFSRNSGSLTAFHTSSTQVAANSGKYHYELYNANPATDTTAEVQFSIAYGHRRGSGSVRETGASVGISPTRAVYSQFRNLLLENTDPNTAFTDAEGNGHGRMFFITMNRARYKQGVNAGNWELHLSSSAGFYASGSSGDHAKLKLIDDSSVSNGDTVNGHLVYNIVSGSETDGVFTDGSGNRHYWGKFYPELGVFAFAGNKMVQNSGPQGSPGLELGYSDSANTNDNMPGKLYDAINRGKYFAIRSEEDVTSTHYFVRAKNQDYNYSTNPTFQTGSVGQLRHNSFIQNPQTFITTVGLYNDLNELLAVAKLSKPMLKNFERETTIRVKLDY